MGRIGTVTPSFFESEELRACSLEARMLAARLLTFDLPLPFQFVLGTRPLLLRKEP
jgi:hypothetical protein